MHGLSGVTSLTFRLTGKFVLNPIKLQLSPWTTQRAAPYNDAFVWVLSALTVDAGFSGITLLLLYWLELLHCWANNDLLLHKASHFGLLCNSLVFIRRFLPDHTDVKMPQWAFISLLIWLVGVIVFSTTAHVLVVSPATIWLHKHDNFYLKESWEQRAKPNVSV